jgi:hypothetical protein
VGIRVFTDIATGIFLYFVYMERIKRKLQPKSSNFSRNRFPAEGENTSQLLDLVTHQSLRDTKMRVPFQYSGSIAVELEVVVQFPLSRSTVVKKI